MRRDIGNRPEGRSLFAGIASFPVLGIGFVLAATPFAQAPSTAACGETAPIKLTGLPEAPRDPTTLRVLRDSANRAYSQGDRERDDRISLRSYREALQLYQQVSPEAAATAGTAIGRAYKRLGQPDSAALFLEQACAAYVAREQFALYLLLVPDLSEVYTAGLHAPTRALTLTSAASEIARDLGDIAAEANVAAARMAAANELGRQDVMDSIRAFAPLLLSRLNGAAAQPTPDVIEANTLLIAADAFGDGPSLDGEARRSARAGLLRAKHAYETAHDSIGIIKVLTRLAQDNARFAQFDSSRVLFEQALAIARKSRTPRPIVAAIHLDLAAVERQLGAPADSIVEQLRAAADSSRGLVGAQVRAAALLALSRALRDAGRVGEAENTLMLVVETQRSRKEALEASDREVLGEAFLLLGKTDSALVHLLAADPKDGSANSWRHHALLGQLLRRLKSATLKQAASHYDSAIVDLSSRARNARSDAERIDFADQYTSLSQELTLLWLSRAGRDVDSATAIAAAWSIANRSRAASILRTFKGSIADLVVAQSDSEHAAEYGVVAGMLDVYGAAPSATLSYLATRDTLLVWLGRPGSALRLARVPIGRDSLARIEASLRAVIGADSAATRMAPIADSTRAPSTPEPTSAKDDVPAILSNILIPLSLRPNLSDSGLLLIIPDGPVGRIPFAALPLGGGDTTVIDRFAIQIAPSLTSLREILAERGRRSPAPRSSALIVGDPRMPTLRTASGATYTLDSLPSAREEAGYVARLLGSDSLIGRRATASNILPRLGTAGVVHFATHALAYGSRSHVGESYIAIAPEPRPGAAPADEGFLTLDALMSEAVPRLRADLVVLSACQTALGYLSDSEGIVGLARAFLAKGASTVVVTQWSVNTDASAAISRSFYRHWITDPDHPTKAEALRRAQREVRTDPKFERPRHWAAFQLIGAP
jgi:tetratricopeptide (TPR) repeat protein